MDLGADQLLDMSHSHSDMDLSGLFLPTTKLCLFPSRMRPNILIFVSMIQAHLLKLCAFIVISCFPLI